MVKDPAPARRPSRRCSAAEAFRASAAATTRSRTKFTRFRLRRRCASHSSCMGMSSTRSQIFEIGIPVAPVRLQILIVELRQIAIQPGGKMHAVGHRRYGNLPNRQLRPQLLPHFLRYLTVQAAHRIAKRGRLDGQDGHRKRLLVIFRTEASQGQEFVERHPAIAAIFAEVFIQQARDRKDRCRREPTCGW